MRTPLSGVAAAPSKDYRYQVAIYRTRERPSFGLSATGSYTDTYFDVGGLQPGIISVATDGVGFAWVWSPGTALDGVTDTGQAITHNNLIVGYSTDLTDLSNETTTTVAIERMTRPGIVWDGSRFLVAYYEAGGANVEVRELTTSPLGLGSVLYSAAHSVTDRTGGTVNPTADGFFWLSFVEDGYLSVRKWDGSSPVGTLVRLCGHPDLTTDDYLSFRAVAWNGLTYMVYPHQPHLAYCRMFRDGRPGAPTPLIGGDSDFAFHHLRCHGLYADSGRIWAVLERGQENSDGQVSRYFTTLAYTEDGRNWSDFCGVTDTPLRGGVFPLGSSIAVMGLGRIFTSPAIRLLGSYTWEQVYNVRSLSWESDLENGNTVGSLELQHGQTTPVLDRDDVVRIEYTTGSATHQIGLFLPDRIVFGRRGNVSTEKVQLTGLSARLNLYAALVDEAFEPSRMRFDRYDALSVVPKLGAWKAESGLLCETDEGGVALVTQPESMPLENMTYQLRWETLDTGQGAVFFYKDNDNYHYIHYDGTQYVYTERVGGVDVDRTVGAAAADDAPHWMIQYVDHVIFFFVSTPTTLPDDETDPSYASWRLVLSYDLYQPGVYETYLGVRGKSGTRLLWSFYVQGEWLWTTGRALEAVTARCSVTPDVYVNKRLNTGAWSSPASSYNDAIVWPYDVDCEIDLSGGDLSFHFGLQQRLAGYGGLRVDLSTNEIRLYLYDYSGSGAGVERQILSFTPHTNRQIDGQRRLRIYLGPEILNRWNILAVYIDEQFYFGTVLKSVLHPGYMMVTGTGQFRDLTLHELSPLMSGGYWRQGTTGQSFATARLRSYLWRFFERDDGRLTYRPADVVGDSLQGLDDTTVSFESNGDYRFAIPVVQVTGAEVYGSYISGDLLGEALGMMNVDAPDIWREEDCVSLAKRYADYYAQRFASYGASGFLDPRLEVGDQVELNGLWYLVTRIGASVLSPRGVPRAEMRTRLLPM